MNYIRLCIATAPLITGCAQIYGPIPYGKGMYVVTATQPTCTRGQAEAATVEQMLKKANSFCEAKSSTMIPVQRQDAGCNAELVFQCELD